MGAGASAAGDGWKSSLAGASDEELRLAAAGVPPEERARLAAALGRLGDAPMPRDASNSAAAPACDDFRALGVAVAGENEDNVDDELAFEMKEQELMFQKMFRKRLERETKKKLEQGEAKRATEAKKAEALEAAFDGELDKLLEMFDNGIELECCDQHNTTVLSEAAAGGNFDLVSLLLGEGADPNSLGRYRRTPLWRAAYAGSAEAVQALLRGGGDPREYDEQGQKPVDVTPNKDAKNYLESWDISATDVIKASQGAFAKQKKANTAKEEAEKSNAQKQELTDATEEAERRLQIARVEAGKKKKFSQNLRAQKVSLCEQGAEGKVAEIEPLLEKAETEWNLADKFLKDLEWKLKRVQLKQRDWESAEQRKVARKAGKLQGFKVDYVLESQADLDSLLEMLTSDFELKKELITKESMILKPGDVLIKEGRFETARDKMDIKKAEIEEEAWPLMVSFNHGFDTTIQIKALSDTLLKDVGDKRKTDGRWPLVIDPSGKSSLFLKYAEATVFTALEMKDSITDPELGLRVRRAFLKQLLYGGAFIVDMMGFDFPVEVLEEAFNHLDKGLWAKLTDRSVMYSYLLTRRFMRLVTAAPSKDHKELTGFHEGSFMDDYLQRFVLGFVTTFKEPDVNFAKLFYTIRVKDPGEETGG